MSVGTPWWGTVLVGFVGPAGVVVGQWMAGRQHADRTRRETRRRARELRGTGYGALFRAVAGLREALSGGAAAPAAMTAVRGAAAELELIAPEAVRVTLPELLAAAERWVAVAAANMPASVAVAEAGSAFEERLAVVRDAMRADLGLDAG